MPLPAYAAAHGAAVGVKRLEPEHALAIGLGLLVVGGLLLMGARNSPGGGPKVPAATTESLPEYTFEPPPEQPVIGPQQHLNGYVYTPHRFPRVCGGEISNTIHYGWASLRIPHDRDMTWLTAPPGEVSL